MLPAELVLGLHAAHLILNNSDALAMVLRQDVVEQRSLARAKEPRDHLCQFIAGQINWSYCEAVMPGVMDLAVIACAIPILCHEGEQLTVAGILSSVFATSPAAAATGMMLRLAAGDSADD